MQLWRKSLFSGVRLRVGQQLRPPGSGKQQHRLGEEANAPAVSRGLHGNGEEYQP